MGKCIKNDINATKNKENNVKLYITQTPPNFIIDPTPIHISS